MLDILIFEKKIYTYTQRQELQRVRVEIPLFRAAVTHPPNWIKLPCTDL